MTYESNIDALAAGTRPSAILRLDGPSAAGGTVGFRLARELAARIAARGQAGEGTAGGWDRNAKSTIERKGFDKPNYVTGQMMDPRHIAGEVADAPAETTMTYGTGEADANGKTDRDRAYYAETGQSRRKIVRSFFGITDSDADALAEIVGEEWESAAGGGPPTGP